MFGGYFFSFALQFFPHKVGLIHLVPKRPTEGVFYSGLHFILGDKPPPTTPHTHQEVGAGLLFPRNKDLVCRAQGFKGNARAPLSSYDMWGPRLCAASPRVPPH